MSGSHQPLILIVAATVKNGIGKNGALPWPMLKKEMAYFARVTKRLPSQLQHQSEDGDTTRKSPQNVVIMGRKTWESIPPKFRPLKGRTNMIISRQSSESFGPPRNDVVVASSIEAGLESLRNGTEGSQDSIPTGHLFVIGGSSIYEAALKMPQTKHVLLTRIHNEYECDTHFPLDLDSEDARAKGWEKASQTGLEELIGEQVDDAEVEETAEDTTVKYRFTLYTRN